MFKYVTNGIHSLAAAQNSIMLVKNDGFLWIAGEGSFGKLGSGNEVNVPKLRRNGAIDQSNVKVFAGKRFHYMVLKNDGRIMGAGQNTSGQLGNGTTQNQSLFGEVIDSTDSEMTDVAYASLGDAHSMILRQDGTLWAMGRNSDNQLGTTLAGNQTKAIMVLDRVAYVAAGYSHTLAVREDGTLWATGSNASGQFGGKATQIVDTLPNTAWINIDITKFTNPPSPVTP
jgi:alpha-tubulin suppressor-like RCC1 family protein